MSGQAPPEMSSRTREILARARRMVPPMLEKFHKGKVPAPCKSALVLPPGGRGIVVIPADCYADRSFDAQDS